MNAMWLSLGTLGLLILNIVVCQQIIDVACPYMFKKTLIQLNSYSKTIKVSNDDVEAEFNVCEKLKNSHCLPNMQACVKKNGKWINAGDKFDAKLSEEDGSAELVSINGDKCGNSTYMIKISFIKYIKLPMIADEKPCGLDIYIADPTLTPTCTGRDGGYLIDVRALKKQNPVILYRNTTKIILGLCKTADECSEADISGCEIAPSTPNRLISKTSTQHAVYDARKALVSLRSSYKPNAQKKYVIKTEIKVKCNWDVELENPNVLGKRDHFEIESKHGCVKLPQTCKYEDFQRYVYDLNGLNRPNGWSVLNTTKKLLINICGQLQFPTKNECSEKVSQVCHLTGNKFISYGGIPLPIEQYQDEDLIIEYLYGSKCLVGNVTTLSRTKITFVCDKKEGGPVLLNDQPCSLDVIWKTPHACPLYVNDAYNFSIPNLRAAIAARSHVTTCKYNQDGVMYNLTPLMLAQKNYLFKDNDNYEYYITICQPLTITNMTYMCGNAQACVRNNSEPSIKKKYISFRSAGEELRSDGISLRYTGGIGRDCGGNLREMLLHFRCANATGPPQLLSKTGNCKYEFLWKTKHACPKKSSKPRAVNCSIYGQDRQKFSFPDNGDADFLLTRKNATYAFNLCHGNYTVNNTNEIPVKNHSASVALLSENCEYFLMYTMSNEIECYGDTFNALRIYLDCSSTIDTFEILSEENCIVNIRLKSQRACTQDNEILQACKQRLESSKQESKQIIPKEYIPKKQSVQSPIQPTNKIANKVSRNCFINSNGHLFLLNDMKQVKIQNKTKNYVIGYNSSNPECDDFVCINGRSIGSLMDACPNTEVDPLGANVKLHFTGDKCEDENDMVTTVVFKCEFHDTANMIEELHCKTTIQIPNTQICSTLKLSRKPEESHTALIIGVIIASFLLVLLIGLVIFKWFKRLVSPYSTIGVFGSKSSTNIYTRNTID